MKRTRRAPADATAWLILLATTAAAPAAQKKAVDLDLYAKLLERYTRAVGDTAGTGVDCAALRGDPDWQRLVEGLAAAPEPTASVERLAFWINAYSILVIDRIARNHPLESIRDVGSLLRPVWKIEVGPVARARAVPRSTGSVLARRSSSSITTGPSTGSGDRRDDALLPGAEDRSCVKPWPWCWPAAKAGASIR